MNFSIRRRVEELSQTQPEGIMKNFDDDENDQPMTSKQSTTSKQLKTSDNTPFMTPNQDNQNDILYIFYLIDNDRISRFAFRLDENSDAFNNQNCRFNIRANQGVSALI